MGILLAVIDCCTGQDRGPDAKAIARLLVDNILAGEHRVIEHSYFASKKRRWCFSLGHPGGKRYPAKQLLTSSFELLCNFTLLFLARVYHNQALSGNCSVLDCYQTGRSGWCWISQQSVSTTVSRHSPFSPPLVWQYLERYLTLVNTRQHHICDNIFELCWEDLLFKTCRSC